MTSRFHCRGRPLSLIVLAGGRSRRMGRDKAFLPFAEGRLIEIILQRLRSRFVEVLLSVSSAEKFEPLGIRCIVDDKPGQGPMMGLKTALAAASQDRSFVLACDIPEFDLNLVKSLIEGAAAWEIVVPESPAGHIEPLFGVYSKAVLTEMTRLLDGGERSLLPLIERRKTKIVPLDRNQALKNLNSMQDYLDFLAGRQGDRGKRSVSPPGLKDTVLKKN